MTKKDKLNKLHYLRSHFIAVIKSDEICDDVFICNEYKRTKGNKHIELFPELVAEITKTGKIDEPMYKFPDAISYDANKYITDLDEKWRWYAKQKLKLISRVHKQLTDGKY